MQMEAWRVCSAAPRMNNSKRRAREQNRVGLSETELQEEPKVVTVVDVEVVVELHAQGVGDAGVASISY